MSSNEAIAQVDIIDPTIPAVIEPQAMASTEEIIAELKAGRMVVLVDEEDRENEGDLVLAADFVTPAAINFMVTHARGLVCLCLTEARCDELGLPMMVGAGENGTQYGTNFTVSIEAREGVTTGISASDRARTIAVAANEQFGAADIVQPGHVFPLRARNGGVLVRAGHTEAGCDLTRLAGLTSAAVICEIMKPDGEMARLPELKEFAREHNLKIGTIADLIEYRNQHETTVVEVARAMLPTEYGEFELVTFRDTIDNQLHFALCKGDVAQQAAPLVRVHLHDFFRDVLLSDRLAARSWPIPKAMAKIADEGGEAVRVVEEGRVRGVGERLEPCLRQGLGEPARGAERHQGVAFAVDEQRRRAHAGDFGAQVDVAQPGEAGEQACCVRQRGVLERARELAADGARLRIALVEQGDETLQRCGRVGGDGGGETFEQCGRLCVGPAGGLYEGRRGADEDQAGEFFGGESGRLQRQLRAQRPGAQDGAGRQAVGQSLRGLREVGGGFGVAVAGQVERRDAQLGVSGQIARHDHSVDAHLYVSSPPLVHVLWMSASTTLMRNLSAMIASTSSAMVVHSTSGTTWLTFGYNSRAVSVAVIGIPFC